MSRGADGIETNFQMALCRKSKKHYEKSTAVKEEEKAIVKEEE